MKVKINGIQTFLANYLGLPRQTVAVWFSNEHVPDTRLNQLNKAFDDLVIHIRHIQSHLNRSI